MRHLVPILAFCAFVGCAGWLHDVRSIVDIADDLCIATLSDPNLDPAMIKLLAGRTAREACNDAAIARTFADQVKAGQRFAKASLERPTP